MSCVVLQLMDTSDMERWKKGDSFPFSVLTNTFKSYRQILNGICNLTQVIYFSGCKMRHGTSKGTLVLLSDIGDPY